MSNEADGGRGFEGGGLSPDEAFSALGDDTRLAILQELGRADDPLSFSELRERLGSPESSRFNYHLGELTGHFVEKGEAGYELRRAGENVVEAVLSGAVTDDPRVERTEIDAGCHQCGAPIEVAYEGERFAAYCTECPGIYGDGDRDHEHADGYLGRLALPSAGIQGRAPGEAHGTALTWQMSEILPAADGVCPRCSAPLDRSADVCEAHDPGEGLCSNCGGRHEVDHVARCTNCIYDQRGALVLALLSDVELLSFLTDHGINPVAPTTEGFSATVLDYEETVRSADPLDARFTLAAGGERLHLDVDDELRVVEVRRESPSE